jgi:hypothetical protein
MTQALTRVFVVGSNMRRTWSLAPFMVRGVVRAKGSFNFMKFPNFDRIAIVCHG